MKALVVVLAVVAVCACCLLATLVPSLSVIGVFGLLDPEFPQLQVGLVGQPPAKAVEVPVSVNPDPVVVNPVVGETDAVSASCPTEREFEELVGVRADIVREEPCAFHWRGDPKLTNAQVPCPTGWICTLGIANPRQTYVYSGDSSLGSMSIFAATWRKIVHYKPGDAVYDSCVFLQKVQKEGEISDPQWTALAGNFSCP